MGRLWVIVVIGAMALVALYVVPLADVVLLSTDQPDLGGARHFVAAANYRAFASANNAGPLVATVVFTLATVAAELLLALLAALLTHRQFPGVQLVRAALVIPYLASTVVIVVLWDFFSDPIAGALPGVLRRLGMHTPDLRGPGFALPAMVCVATYEAFPFAYLVILSRLFQIPASHYELASIFGGGAMATFRHVTWPQIRRALGTLLVLRLLITVMKIDVPWLVYASHAPSHWGDTFAVRVYRLAFESLQPGLAAAASVIFVAGITILYLSWLMMSSKDANV